MALEIIILSTCFLLVFLIFFFLFLILVGIASTEEILLFLYHDVTLNQVFFAPSVLFDFKSVLVKDKSV